MEVLIGITGKDFVLLAADTTSARSIVIMKEEEDKTRELNKHNLLLTIGEAGDAVQFAEYIQRNIKLYEIRNGVPLSTKAVAAYTRREMADSLRSRNAYQVNILIGGVDPKTGAPELYWSDYLAASQKMPFATQGYASYFVMSTMDRYWRADLELAEARALLQKCFDELKKRFIGNLPKFLIKVVERDGIRTID
ncbi:nucleophile aminohydrolase [Cladochytrium replicatum]|nr:nucleophile aminohydrolase [Cladochytrium replicatum]